jgi:signal transduction histidine kinase
MEARRHPFLIVDDESAMLESMRHMFRRRYDVFTALSAAEAIKILESHEVHVILSDQRMPGTTGDEFLALAREIQPDAVRLLYTGYADIQAVISAVNLGGIFRYILKPCEPDELAAAVKQAADQYELLSERRRLIAELEETNVRLTQANLELAESSQLKTAFLEVASHEFNTPITIVQGLSDLLSLTNTDRSPFETEILTQIGEGTRQLSRLVRSTLKLLDTGAFREPLHWEPVDVAALLRAAAAQVRPFAESRTLRFHVDIPEDLGEIVADSDKIRDAVLNVLTNAIKFTPDGGEIGLSARDLPPEMIEIEVSDRGIGLTARELNRLFDPFFTQFDPSRHSSGDLGFCKRGLGLGLSLVKKFVKMHHGTVEAESEHGLGTTIRMRLPRKPVPDSNPL